MFWEYDGNLFSDVCICIIKSVTELFYLYIYLELQNRTVLNLNIYASVEQLNFMMDFKVYYYSCVLSELQVAYRFD